QFLFFFFTTAARQIKRWLAAEAGGKRRPQRETSTARCFHYRKQSQCAETGALDGAQVSHSRRSPSGRRRTHANRAKCDEQTQTRGTYDRRLVGEPRAAAEAEAECR